MQKTAAQAFEKAVAEADRLISQGAYTQARRVLKRFANIGSDKKTGLRLQFLIGKSYLSEGKWKKAHQILDEILPVLLKTEDFETAAAVLHYTGDCHIYKGDMEKGADFYRQSLQLCEEKSISGLMLGLDFSALALIDRLEGKYVKALSGWERAIPIYASLSENLYQADALINCAIMRSFLGEAEHAIDNAREARKLLSKIGHRPRATDCLWLLGVLQILNKGDFSSGQYNLDQAVQESGGVGGLEVYRIYSAYSDVLTKIGALDEAREYCENALSVANRFNYSLGVAQCYLILARIRRLENDHVATLQYALEAKSLFHSAAYNLGTARALIIESQVHIHNRKFPQAEKALEKARTVAEGTDDIILRSDCAVAELLLLMGQNKTADRMAEPLEKFSKDLKDNWWHQYLKVRYHLAIMTLLGGKSASVGKMSREMFRIVREMAGRMPEKYRESFIRHPLSRGIMELCMRVGFSKALRDLAPEDTITAVDTFCNLTSKSRKQVVDSRAASITPPEMIYRSSQMQEVVKTSRQIAQSEIPVLIEGETGVGKEMLARFINRLSGRKGQFVPLNCAAVPASLMESELFGYSKGAFTGADTEKKGLVLAANNGTLFLDEIGNMAPDMQAKLLRVLEESCIRPLGSTEETAVNVRILSATNRDLKEDVENGRFREDLFYRINVVTIKLPPLRKRRDDIPVLIEYFLKNTGSETRIENDALESLVKYDWPGNVRELKNEVSRLVSISGGIIENNMLKEEIHSPASQTPGSGALQDMERKMIEDVLKTTGYNKQKAAKLLGISRTTLYRKIRRHRISCVEP